MKDSSQTRCRECGQSFTVTEQPYFHHLLRCQNCGKVKIISFQELGELHMRYVKGLGLTRAVLMNDPEFKRISSAGGPISPQLYRTAVEKIAGYCDCGGKYLFDAPARCPNCRSTDLEECIN